MTLEEKIEEIVKHKLISINNANVVSVNDGFKQELLALIKEEAVKARLSEVERISRYAGAWMNPATGERTINWVNMEVINERIAQLQAELEESNIDADITPEQHQAIWTLRQLINEVFVKEGRQVSNQFIYDNVKGILK